MATFTGKEDARAAAVAVVRSALRRDDDLLLYRLLGWLELEGKQFAGALDIYRRIDALSNAQGAELYGLADRVFKEGGIRCIVTSFEFRFFPQFCSCLPP